MKIAMILTVLICVMMSGISVAEGDQTYGTMSRDCSDCPDCAECPDVMDAMENLPFAQFDAMATTATSGIVIEEKWAYGKMNVCPTGIEHVCWHFEEGSNLFPLQNEHPDIASFETVYVSGCYGDNEPSYVVRDALCGPRCRCYMHIYPYNTRFDNGTPLPYIHIVNGDAAFSPRAVAGGMQCYYPACRALIAFKDDTNFVSFLASTNWNLYVRAYDKKGNYLGGRTIYYTTDRIGDGPSNFTRFTMHTPGSEIGYLTFSGPFNGWHIDDLIAGGEFGYLNLPFDYSYVAERASELEGVPYLEHGLGHDWTLKEYLSLWQLQEGMLMKYWNPEAGMFEVGTGISDEGLVLWAYNYDSQILAGTSFVKWCTSAKMAKQDFKVDVDPCDAKPGDVFFIDDSGDGVIDTIGMVVAPNAYGDDLLMSSPDNGVQYHDAWGIENHAGFAGYKRLDSNVKGGHDPIPGH